METLTIVLAIFGCAEDFNDCTKIAGAELQFASQAECSGQIDEALRLRTDLPFPIITARCDPLQDEALIATLGHLTSANTAVR